MLGDEGHLVRESEREVAISVVDELDHLRCPRATTRGRSLGDAAEEGLGTVGALRVDPADDLRERAHLRDRAALDGALGAQGEPEPLGVAADLGEHDPSGRADAHRAPEHHERILAEARRDALHRHADPIEIRPLLTHLERGAHRDDVDVLPVGRRRRVQG